MTDRATRYAERVSGGDVVAGKPHILACKRHLHDLERAAITQAEGGDSAAEARKLLEDGGLEQKITAQVRGCTDLIAGDCVVLQEPVTGLYGLCWIDSDTHIWKGGDYTTKLVLNFRSLMDEIEAGKA